MTRLARIISAFLLSPVAYILIYMTAIAVFLRFTDREDISGVEFYMPMYFLYVLVSIPIFLMVVDSTVGPFYRVRRRGC